MAEQEQEKYYKRERGVDKRRRTPGAPHRRFQVSEVHALHKEIQRRLVLGQKNRVIAKALGISEVTVSYTKNSPVIQEGMEMMSGARDAEVIDLKREISRLAPQAFKNVQEVINKGSLNGTDASLSLIMKESNNILDRDLGKPTQTVKGVHAHAVFTAEDIEAIKTRALIATEVVNVTPAA